VVKNVNFKIHPYAAIFNKIYLCPINSVIVITRKLNIIIGGVLIVLFLISTSRNGFSQDRQNSFFSTLFIEGQAHYGFLIPHHRELWTLTDGFFPLREITISRQSFGKHPAQYLRKYPRFRLTYLYSDFGKSEQLGKMHAVIPNIKLPLITGKKSKLMFGFGLGVAHLSEKFHQTENYQNLAIGSYYNAAIQFSLSWRIRINQQFYLNFGASMLHVSNGTIKPPNYGLNIPALFVGLNLKFNNKEINYIKPEQTTINKGKINLRLMGLAATKQILSQPETDFGVLAGSISISRYYSNLNTYMIGIDGIYDESTKYLLEQDKKPTEDWHDVIKIGVFGAHEWNFTNMAVSLGLGYYLQNHNPNDTPVYTKIGINYNFLKFTFVGLSLRTHWAKADFLSVGLGLKF
jgi:hypothetical protein